MSHFSVLYIHVDLELSLKFKNTWAEVHFPCLNEPQSYCPPFTNEVTFKMVLNTSVLETPKTVANSELTHSVISNLDENLIIIYLLFLLLFLFKIYFSNFCLLQTHFFIHKAILHSTFLSQLLVVDKNEICTQKDLNSKKVFFLELTLILN